MEKSYPSSKRFCRLIRIQWIQETSKVSKQEESYITEQIQNLKTLQSKIGIIQYSLFLTMVDGKVCNTISSTSGMRCYICKATISEMNSIYSLQENPAQAETYKFGLCVLHAYIRFLECLLHIAYRLELKVWKVTKDNKPLLECLTFGMK